MKKRHVRSTAARKRTERVTRRIISMGLWVVRNRGVPSPSSRRESSKLFSGGNGQKWMDGWMVLFNEFKTIWRRTLVLWMMVCQKWNWNRRRGANLSLEQEWTDNKTNTERKEKKTEKQRNRGAKEQRTRRNQGYKEQGQTKPWVISKENKKT